MRVLKQSTAATVLIGPFLDKTDGVTEEAGLAGAGTELSKAGGAFAAGPTLGTHDSDGWYPISLTTTHTNTLGDLTVKVHDAATHLPVWAHFTVLPANSYDALVSGSGVGMRSDVQGWLGTAPATPTTNGVPEVDITHIAGAAVSTSTAQLGVNTVNAGGTAWGSGAITAASVATGAIDADALAADAGTEIATAVWASATRTLTALDEDSTTLDLDATIRAAMGLAAANLDTQLALIQADTDDIQTRLPAALVGGRIDASVGAMAADTVTASALAADAVDEILDEVIEGTTTLRQALRGFASALLAKASGLATTTAVYRDLADTKARITATVDADGNRTAVVLDLT